MIEYSNLKGRKHLVERAARTKERIDASTVDERDKVLHALLVWTYPSRESQLS